VPNTFDWNNQVLDSLWWITWVSAVSVIGSAIAGWLILRLTGWGRQFLRLALPYFRPAGTLHSWRPLLTVLLMIVLTVAAVRIDVLLTYQSNGMYTALQELNSATFFRYIVIFAVVATVYVIRALFAFFITNMFLLQWREGLNAEVVADWIDKQAYYRGMYTEEPVDNPDQRIQEDITSFTTNSESLAIGAINAMVSLVSFTVILWELSGPLTLFGVEIPRAMTFITYLYVGIATVIAFKIGHPLVRLNFLNERFNAFYRYALIRVRDNAENIALYQGEQVEARTLAGRFGAIIANYWALVFRSLKFQGFNASVSQVASVFPVIVQAPRFFSGAIKLGDLQQTASAFGSVHDSLSFFRNSYDTFAGYRAVLDRLTGLLDVNAEAHALPVVPTEELTEGLRIRDLTVRRPDGQELVSGLDLDLEAGAALVVKGGSGTGRTSLLRSIAGFWPYATGTVHRPLDDRSLFLSQQPYLPFGTLRNALAYPEGPEAVSEERGQEVLRAVFLGHLVEALDEEKAWWRILSPGEQQRIGFARILLVRPSVVFLDESTSSVDEGLEFALYSLVREQLPDTTVFSIGHRSTLNQLHSHHLELLPGGRWTLDVPVG
jgi:putative ATP-binding cassette transporter